jgi:hypothetical protein
MKKERRSKKKRIEGKRILIAESGFENPVGLQNPWRAYHSAEHIIK